ncbi:hypothetical protein QYF36_023783 [Acer negundo]|nr:hypothetical protein QYF36_023783 [Acer negundo]
MAEKMETKLWLRPEGYADLIVLPKMPLAISTTKIPDPPAIGYTDYPLLRDENVRVAFGFVIGSTRW